MVLTNSVAMILPSSSSAFRSRFHRDRQHPSDGIGRAAGIFQFADFHDVFFVAVFDDPVVAGETAIDDAVDDISADFLGAEQDRRNLVVINARKNAPLGDGNAIAGPAEKFDRGSLQAAAGQAEAQRGLGECHGR